MFIDLKTSEIWQSCKMAMHIFLSCYSKVDYVKSISMYVCCLFFVLALHLLLNKVCKFTMTIKKIILYLVFSAYVTFMFEGMLFYRNPSESCMYSLVPFRTTWEAITRRNLDLCWQIVYNIIVFVPWGVLVAVLYDRWNTIKVVICSAATQSLVIEVLQLVLKRGFFEFDDIVHNTLGAVCGYAIWLLWSAKKITLKSRTNPDRRLKVRER